MPLWAVHISDGVLTFPVWIAGFVLAAVLLYLGSRRVSDEEIPRIALVTAAFFVASTIHVPVPPTSVHLLLNGLAGVLLATRAVIAISGGLFLQAVLIGHGGYFSLGANICVLSLPALLACIAHHFLSRQLREHRGMVCSLLVFASCFFLVISTVYSGAMVGFLIPGNLSWQENLEAATRFALQLWVIILAVGIALVAARIERRIHATGHFALGFFLGSLTVLITSGLNCVVLLLGGEKIWPVAPWALVVLHLPVAVLEGFVMGITINFLTRVKPELLMTNERTEEQVTIEA